MISEIVKVVAIVAALLLLAVLYWIAVTFKDNP